MDVKLFESSYSNLAGVAKTGKEYQAGCSYLVDYLPETELDFYLDEIRKYNPAPN